MLAPFRILRVLALFLPMTGLLTIGQEAEHPKSSVEILRVAEKSIEIRIRNGESYPVKVKVSDKARRLNDFGYQWESLTDKGWIALTPRLPAGAEFGDEPPQFLDIAAGQTVMVPEEFHAKFWGVHSGMKLRIVVKVWHSQQAKDAKETRIASSPLIWMEPFAKQ
jgi:hypothetical protein